MASASSEGATKEDDGAAGSSGMFECNICLEAPKDPVVSMCGHLFWYWFCLPF